MLIREYRPEDETQLVALWRKTNLIRPWNDPIKDIARKLKVQAQWFFVIEQQQQIIASAMAGYDGHRGWVNYLAVDPDYQGQGIARNLMQHIEQSLKQVGCPKINLQLRKDNAAVIKFYQRLDYCEDQVVSMGKRLIED